MTNYAERSMARGAHQRESAISVPSCGFTHSNTHTNELRQSPLVTSTTDWRCSMRQPRNTAQGLGRSLAIHTGVTGGRASAAA